MILIYIFNSFKSLKVFNGLKVFDISNLLLPNKLDNLLGIELLELYKS